MGFIDRIRNLFGRPKSSKPIENLNDLFNDTATFNFKTGQIQEDKGVVIDEFEDEILPEEETTEISESFNERVKRLKINQKFMQELTAVMQHSTSERIFYIHGTTDISTSKRIIKQGLLRVDKAAKYDENLGDDPMYTTAECIDDIIQSTSNMAHDEVDYIIEYGNSRGERGKDSIVIIDNPIEDGKRKQIIQPISAEQQIQISTQWKGNRLAQSVVQPMYIVGYVDKVNAQVILNPLYYDYEKLSQRMAELPEINSDILSSAIGASKGQVMTSEINDSVDEIKRGYLEKEEEKIIEQDDGRWEF